MIVLAERARTLEQSFALDLVEHGERRRRRDRVPAVRPAEAAGMDRVHQLGASRDGGDREPRAE